MTKDESQHHPHHKEVPEPCPMETTHQPSEPGELHRFPDGKSCQHRKDTQHDHSGVGLFLQGVVWLVLLRLWTKEEVMLHHRPNAWNVAPREQNLFVVAAEDVI